MVLGSRRARTALHVPVLLFLPTSVFVATTGIMALRKPDPGSIVAVALCVGLFLLVLADVRVIQVRENRLLVRGPFAGHSLDASACGFGISVSAGGHGLIYHVYAADRLRRVDLADAFSQAGAERLASDLQRLLLDGTTATGRRASMQAEVDEDWQRLKSQQASGRAEVDAYYRSSAFRRARKWILVGVVAYVAIAGAYLLIAGQL